MISSPGEEWGPGAGRRALARAACAAAALTLPVYLLTMNRTIGFIDRGELAAAAWTLGIAHPTGYPTFTLLGWLVSHLLPLRPVLALNAFAALLVASGAAGLVLLFDDLLRRAARGGLGARDRARLALLGALFTALSATWWQQAGGFEVYSLHAALLPLVILLFLRWTDAASAAAGAGASARPESPRGAGFAFALVLGLAFTNHMTTVLLAPGLLWYAWVRLRGHLLRRVVALAPPFLLGLLPYAYLPLRSALHPRFDWGAPRTLRAFLDHVGAREFRGWMFSAPDVFAVQVRYLLHRLPWDLAWAGLVPAALGVALLARRDRGLAAAAGLVVAASAFFSCGYRIRDLDPYLLGCVVGLGIFTVVGLLALHERFGPRSGLAAGLALVALGGTLHLGECDESRNRLVKDLTRNQLEGLPPRALLFTRQWDYLVSASAYFQEVEGLRRDVLVLSPDLLRHPWYLDELGRRAPDLIARAAAEAAAYRAALRPYQQHRPYDPSVIRARFLAFVDSLAARALRDRPVLCTPDAADVLRGPWTLAPTPLALALRPDSGYLPAAPPRLRIEPWPGHMDAYVATTYWIYAGALVRRAEYERDHGRAGLARGYLELAASLDPGIPRHGVRPLPLDGNLLVRQAAELFDRLKRRHGAADLAPR